jgi:nucleotide-binding universal stress UspA family protein
MIEERRDRPSRLSGSRADRREVDMATTTSGIKRIVVGVDGSDSGKAALTWTVRFAKAVRAQVVAVYALELPVALPEPYAMPLLFDEKWRAGLKKEFEQTWCRPLHNSGLKYTAVMLDGRPATVIADVADQTKADVIVVGRRGRGEVAELLLGSVSHELSLHSKRPVLLVPRKP